MMLNAPQTEIRGRIQQSAMEGVYREAPDVGLFDNFAGAADIGIKRAGATAVYSLTDPLIKYAENWAVPADEMFGTKIEDFLSQQRKLSLDYVDSLKPDPYHTGKASELAFGLASVVPQVALLSVGGPATMALGTGAIQGYTDFRLGEREGLDPVTAMQRGLLTAEATAIGIAAPASLGTGLLTKAATGAGLNTAIGGAQRYATGELLRSRGYDDMADQYKVFDGWAIAGDAIMGAAFGGVAHFSARQNALSLNDSYQAHVEASPGAPEDPQSKAAHIEALSKATEQLINGDPVEVGKILEGRDNFIPRPQDPELSRAYDESLDELGLKSLMDEARTAEEQAAALRNALMDKPLHIPEEFNEFSKTYEKSRLGTHTAAKDFVIKKQSDDGNEHVLFIDDDANSATDYMTSGKKNRVDLDERTLKKISDPKSNLIVHHNHPSGSSLSMEDIYMLSYPGLKKVVAHGKDGEFSSARLTDEMRESLSGKSIDEAQYFLYDLYTKSEQETRKNLTEMMDSGMMTKDQADAVYYEIVNRSLGNAGVLRYTDSQAVDALPEDMYNMLQDASDNWVRFILEEGKVNVSKDKNTVTVRPGEGTQRVFGGDEGGKADTGGKAGDREGGVVQNRPKSESSEEGVIPEILTEKPDLEIPTDTGPAKAGEVFKEADNKIAEARKTRDVYLAAVNCAIRNGT